MKSLYQIIILRFGVLFEFSEGGGGLLAADGDDLLRFVVVGPSPPSAKVSLLPRSSMSTPKIYNPLDGIPFLLASRQFQGVAG